jgi:2'-5' RNA ligase
MNFGPFELKVKGVGTFGGKSASVLWIGTESDELNAIAEAIDKELIEIGFPPEKRAFKGHLTLARIRNFDAGTKIIEACKEYKDFDAKSSLVDTVTVYQSQLTNQGSIYTVIDKSELTPNA